MDNDALAQLAREVDWAGEESGFRRGFALILIGVVALLWGGWALCWRAGGVLTWVVGPVLMRHWLHLLVTALRLAWFRGRPGHIQARWALTTGIATAAGLWLGWIAAPMLSLAVLPSCYATELVVRRAGIRVFTGLGIVLLGVVVATSLGGCAGYIIGRAMCERPFL